MSTREDEAPGPASRDAPLTSQTRPNGQPCAAFFSKPFKTPRRRGASSPSWLP